MSAGVQFVVCLCDGNGADYLGGNVSNELRELPRMRPLVLRNLTCAYCACSLGKSNSTKEHVVGRRFVPRGTLNRDWNLILQACKDCNHRKSDLEDDISAITMLPDAYGRSASDECSVEAERKRNRSRSRRTGKLVSDSAEAWTISAPFIGGGAITFEMTGPPQIESARAFELARLQMMAFFYFLTYDQVQARGHYWQGGFYPLLEARREDWGNVVHRSFMAAVVDWEPRLLVSTANDHFAAAIRRHPDAACWSWAVEWNKNYRLVGFFGELAPAKQLADSFPSLDVSVVAQEGENWAGYRSEVPLNEEDDILFHWAPK